MYSIDCLFGSAAESSIRDDEFKRSLSLLAFGESCRFSLIFLFNFKFDYIFVNFNV